MATITGSKRLLSISTDSTAATTTMTLGGVGVATEGYVTTQISNLVASAPGTLDTLNELAAALGDDASFSTTVSTALGNRLRIDTNAQGLNSTQKANGRTNLGLGTASTSATTAFATAAQGTKADTAHGWGDHSAAGYITSQRAISSTPTNGATTTAISSDWAFDNVKTAVPANAVFTDTQYSVGDNGLTQKNFTSALKTKLDGIATSANNYSLPEATATARGGIELFSNTDQTVAANSISTTAGRTYGIQLNSAGQAVVNVPWTDNNTTYTVGDGGLTEKNFTSALKTKLDGIAASANNYSHPTHPGDDFSVDTGALGGFNVVSDIDINVTTDTLGHVTDANGSVATRQLSNLRIPDTRAAEIAPDSYLDNALSLDFTDEFGSLGSWYSGITLKGWSAGYAAWQLISNSTSNTNDQNLYFRSGLGATWGTMHKVYHSGNLSAGTNVSISAAGVISSTDTNTQLTDAQVRSKISGTGLIGYNSSTGVISTTANNYVHPTTAGNKHIPSGGAAGQFLKYSSSGTAVWAAPSYTTSLAWTSITGKPTLDNYVDWKLVDGANTANNITSAKYIRFEGSNINGTGTLADPFVVNTPDSNTTYTADGNYGMTLSGTAFRLENDRRRNSSTQDIYTGNTHDYTFYDADIGIRWYTAGAEEMRLEDDGDLHVDGDVIAFSTTVSDARLKDDVQTLENATEKVNKLRGVSYTWNQGSRKGQREIGVIAQEVEEVVPEIVHEKKLPFVGDETYKTVDYEKLVALLIESNKELTARVEQLEARLDGTTK